jgi:hypothetical protein
MKKTYCVGLCPFCFGQGLLYPLQEEDKISFICDEAYHRFDTFEDIAKRKLSRDFDLTEDYMELEAFLRAMPELEKEVFVFENHIWRNLLDDGRELFNVKNGNGYGQGK